MSQDKLTTLSISMQRQKGVYALLLGSGVSQASSIPTGWTILNLLIEKVALVQKKSIEGDPVDWYRENFRKEPVYGDLLEIAADTTTERAAIIREYIEPNEEERELGLKQPTDAHRAIASLVADGYIRVIVTTNFDRLLETALTEVGVTPNVISTEDGITGTRPLAHNACTIIKIHGDYIDARIRNTTSELSGYDDGIQRLLRQVLREYGLVISGWSAEWDTALVHLLQDERSPWFSTYWVAYSEPKEAAQTITDARKAGVITHMGAEEFFTKLSESVQALADHENTELLSLAIAEASLKRYLDDPTKRIRIYDLVVNEATRVAERVFTGEPGNMYADISAESVEARLREYENASETLRTLFVTGCYWGKAEHTSNWAQSLERLANFGSTQGNHYTDWLKLRYYPALLLLYSGGVAAIASQQYQNLYALLYQPTNKEVVDRDRSPLIMSVHCSILTDYIANQLEPRRISSFILPWRMKESNWFWAPLEGYIPDQDRKLSLFFEFEYMFGLVHTDIALQSDLFSAWGPRGTIDRHYSEDRITQMTQEIEQAGESWAPLRAGMFGGSQERLSKAKEAFEERLRRNIMW